MIKPDFQHNERERQKALEEYEILDTLPERDFDDITQIASVICNTPIALISLIDKDRQWFKSRVGLEAPQTSRDVSFCAHAIHDPEHIFEITDARKDERFHDNPLVTEDPRIVFYAGSPLVSPEGHLLGTLCVIDRVSKKLSEEQKKSLAALSRQVVSQLELRKKNKVLEKARRQYQTLIENVDDFVFEANAKGMFTYCNPLMSEEMGFSSEELLTMHYTDLVHPDDRHRVKEFYREQIANGADDCYIEFRVLIKSNPEVELIVGQKSKLIYEEGELLKVTAISRNITREVQLQRKFDENAELYKLISESAQDLVCMHNLKGEYTYVSPSVVDNLGYTPEEILGTSPYDLMHPEDIERAQKEAHQPLLEGEKENYFEYRLRHKDGRYLWFESISTAIEDEEGKVVSLRSSTRNIQIRKEQEAIINNQRSRLESFVLATPAPVAMFDTEMKYLAYSSQWLKTYGLEGRDIIGVSHYEIFPEIGDDWKKIHSECLQGKTHRKDEDRFEREDGSIQWIKWEVRPWYNRKGDIGGVIMLTDDVTKIKEQEIELREAKEKAEIASQAKANFLSVMSHEIRTPLNAVIGMSHLLMQEDPREDQLHGLKLIRFSGENLLSLVNDILDYNKIEAGKIDLENIEFSLEELVNNIKHTHAYKADEKSIMLKLLYDKDIPSSIIGDPSRLSQVLNNLLSNAIKFTREGSVRIKVEELSRTKDEIELQFEIRDTGIGISEENLAKIFDRFVQAESYITRSFGGTGLGLSITKRLVEIMGGEIKVKSKVNEGSTFSFVLKVPYKEQSENQVDLGGNYESQKDINSLNIHVLLVEDNQANQFVATKFLEKWGVKVSLAQNGNEAIDLIKSKAFDLVLMDLQMPQKDGLTASKEIRQMEEEYFQKVPILALTASSDAGTMNRIREFGMNDIVVKPFMPSELHKKIIASIKGSASPVEPVASEKVSRQVNVSLDSIKASLKSYSVSDERFTNSLLGSFILNLEEFVQQFPGYIKNKDESSANFILHKMRTTFRMCGQNDLTERIEQCIQSMAHEEERPMVPSIIEDCERLAQLLREYRGQD